MADLVDPAKLVSVAQVAKEYGYNPNYLSNLAAQGKLKAWQIGKTWATTREILEAYIKITPPPGRPKNTATTQRRHSRSTKK